MCGTRSGARTTMEKVGGWVGGWVSTAGLVGGLGAHGGRPESGAAADGSLPAWSRSALLAATSIQTSGLPNRQPLPQPALPVLPAGGCLKYTDKWAERDVGLGGKDEWGDKWEETFKNGSGNKKVRCGKAAYPAGWVAVFVCSCVDCAQSVCGSKLAHIRPFLAGRLSCLPACATMPPGPPAACLPVPACRERLGASLLAESATTGIGGRITWAMDMCRGLATATQVSGVGRGCVCGGVVAGWGSEEVTVQGCNACLPAPLRALAHWSSPPPAA
jgi:hypothetical protein